MDTIASGRPPLLSDEAGRSALGGDEPPTSGRRSRTAIRALEQRGYVYDARSDTWGPLPSVLVEADDSVVSSRE
jgi:hypothetical protein